MNEKYTSAEERAWQIVDRLEPLDTIDGEELYTVEDIARDIGVPTRVFDQWVRENLEQIEAMGVNVYVAGERELFN